MRERDLLCRPSGDNDRLSVALVSHGMVLPTQPALRNTVLRVTGESGSTSTSVEMPNLTTRTHVEQTQLKRTTEGGRVEGIEESTPLTYLSESYMPVPPRLVGRTDTVGFRCCMMRSIHRTPSICFSSIAPSMTVPSTFLLSMRRVGNFSGAPRHRNTGSCNVTPSR